MPHDVEFPSTVMYGSLKQFAGISNKALAGMLFSKEYRYGGTSIHERLEERTFLTRNIVHAAPDSFSESAFQDLPSAACKVCATVLSRQQGSTWRQEYCEFLAGPAAERMCEALDANGLNSKLYRNLCGRLMQMRLDGQADRAELLTLLMVTTGCLGNPARAVEITQERVRLIVSIGFRTTIAGEMGASPITDAEDTTSSRIGLCRIESGKLVMPIHLVSSSPEGIEIGLLATTPGAINDVDPTVSRRHLRVFYDVDGHWKALGLDSTNGTTVIRGETKEVLVVEPPRAHRGQDWRGNPVDIYPSDILCLAGKTQFMVLEVTE